ncbi:MAG: YggS family pyridoxal phosphate-dependent enzyme [Bacteroidia bacterium]|nr:YggS family pyridoxal phosphate-dependent enzyme [Bacteroidia bacterium]
MSDIAANITLLKHQIPSSVKLVAVSKTKTVSDILKAYNAGQRYFGENRVQELLNKKDLLPRDIEWHLIGHLQSNKIKFIVPFIKMIQSVDSYKLLATINSEASKISRVVDCLLQIHIATEETKFGFSMNEFSEMSESQEYMDMKFVKICGVMGMATFTSNTDQVRKEFSYLADCFNSLKNRYFPEKSHFKEISMGMSGDYEIALKEGSTIVRIGSLIFGERNKIQ